MFELTSQLLRFEQFISDVHEPVKLISPFSSLAVPQHKIEKKKSKYNMICTPMLQVLLSKIFFGEDEAAVTHHQDFI